tara:strand:- start:835 stop:1167 length:333 start_codon:yes stop_codon:yes gene_type:complete
MASLISAFIEAGAVEILVDVWRSQREKNEEERRLAYEQRIASALARGDLDVLELHADRLLAAAEESNHRRGAPDHSGRSGSRDGNGNDVAMDADDADVETLQAEIDALID